MPKDFIFVTFFDEPILNPVEFLDTVSDLCTLLCHLQDI